ncbi:MAG: hypothetical protein RL141_413 [Candidatus Parcubacteria bacterium]|jgi:hypothetical protein
MRNFTKSEKQWVASFIVIDLVFLLLLAGACVFQSEECGIALTFAPLGFFAPFWLWLMWIGLNFSFMVDVLLVIVSGIFFHGCIGWIIGFLLRQRSIKWFFSIPLAIVCVILMAILGNMLGTALHILG